MECPICLENIILENKKITLCNHIFHDKCLSKWI